jgi:tetratricopeptide (TPR) repeat protein
MVGICLFPDEKHPGQGAHVNDVDYFTPEYLQGTVALHAGRLADALAAFELVSEGSPSWVMAQGNIGLALLRMDRYQEAEAKLRGLLAQLERRECPYPPAHIQFMRNLAEAILKQGRGVEAIREFAKAARAADTLATEYPSLAAKLKCEKAFVLNSCGTACLFLDRPDQAVAALNEARELFRRYSGGDRTGQAEALTNLAVALAATGQETSAGLALEEAIDIVGETEDYDQLFRTIVVAAKMGSNIVRPDTILEIIEAGAEDALATGRPGTAYVRYCMGVSLIIGSAGDLALARKMIRCARELEDRLDPLDPHVPELRYHEALVLRLAEKPIAQIAEVLIEGAHHWYQRIALPLIPADLHYKATDLHLHFRILAACLLDLGRVEEALVAFEAGRGLGYAVEIDTEFFSRVIAQNPFAVDGRSVNLALLRLAQESVNPGEVVVVLAVIPPRMVAFLISPNGRVGWVSREIASTQKDLELLDAEIKMVPHRLAEGVEMRAVPKTILAFAQDVAAAVGARTVSRFVPYDSLHLIPWRAVLNHCGLPWLQLSFPTGFNFLLRQSGYRSQAPNATVIALGHGRAGSTDLQNEARDFATAFGNRGTVVLQCTGEAVRQALESGAIVLLSCHGKAFAQPDGPRLFLELNDGQAPADEVFPARVFSPTVILSACDSGVYFMAWGDYPMGAAPLLLRRGAGCVIGARFPVRAGYAASFFASLGRLLAEGIPIEVAFARTLEKSQTGGADWKDLACFELLKAV